MENVGAGAIAGMEQHPDVMELRAAVAVVGGLAAMSVAMLSRR